MVTNLDTSRQLVSQRAPSVSSRASSSRRNRQSRSHFGGTPSSSQNEYPFFAQTGDVEVSLTTSNGRKEQRYLIHRLILAQSAGFFDEDIRDDNSRALTASASELHQPRPVGLPHTLVDGPPLDAKSISAVAKLPPSGRRKRWRYVLDWGNTDDTSVPMLVQRNPTFMEESAPPPVSRNKPPVSNGAFFRSMANFSALNLNPRQENEVSDPDDDVLRDYDNLFRIFYNYQPSLDVVNIANAYTECKALLHLAEIYDALEVVGPRIDYHLLRFGNRLFKQIAKYPPSYLKLGYLARSKVIFAEALIHVVGQWPQARPMLQGQTDPAVLDLVEDKVDILEETKAKIEGKLFRLSLSTSRGERVTPANGFLDWLTLSLFRQWLAENTAPDPTPTLPSGKETTRPSSSTQPATLPGSRTHSTTRDNRMSAPPSSLSRAIVPASTSRASTQLTPSSIQAGRIYRLLGASKDAYLPHDEIKRFLKCAPEGLYTRENLRRMEKKMDEIKAQAKDVVRPLVRNCLELDLVAAGLVGEDRGREGRHGGGTQGLAGLGYLTCTRVGEGDFPWEE
ncbi:Pre-mRNA-splicing factor CLF1 [Sphaceloma murrayae]|uniref:Pre-mRNA-splicing factor CLF1 n=1 Tax=Sphaceloma murrayae TaxID=2082308 RepID=A0A2K1QIC6_9PEZI|nr:Pre-mRNA-splicing factor CLF1 [Sphaceloma murrayae]